MTFAACKTETVDPPVVVTADEPSPLNFASLPGVADPLEGGVAALLDGASSLIAELGATSAADGGTEPTDADGAALAAERADGADDD